LVSPRNHEIDLQTRLDIRAQLRDIPPLLRTPRTRQSPAPSLSPSSRGGKLSLIVLAYAGSRFAGLLPMSANWQRLRDKGNCSVAAGCAPILRAGTAIFPVPVPIFACGEKVSPAAANRHAGQGGFLFPSHEEELMRRIDAQHFPHLFPSDPLLSMAPLSAHTHHAELIAPANPSSDPAGDENTSWEAAWIDLGGEG
jgi:hypothetical protein